MVNYEDLLGDLLGKGNYRDVHQHKTSEDLVIKKIRKGKLNQNEIEWKVWLFFKDTKYKNIFCPCHSLSEDKQYLIMRKALCYPHHKVLNNNPSPDFLKKLNSLPDPILPKNIHDIENTPHNWGILDGRKVIVDYGAKSNFNLISK